MARRNPKYFGVLYTEVQQSGNFDIDAAINTEMGDRQKPEMITYYNLPKNGEDLDKMCSLYDVYRNSRRWPVFYDLLNLSALNALCTYSEISTTSPIDVFFRPLTSVDESKKIAEENVA